MQVATFDTAGVPRAERLAAFRRGAPHFRIDPLTDPAEFHARWHLLRLGDVNLIRSRIAPVRYRRDAGMIAADGEGRLTIHIRLAGSAGGTIDGEPVRAEPGGATIWDLARPLDVHSAGDSDVLIVTLPRHMLYAPEPEPDVRVLDASPGLALATRQALDLLRRAPDLPEGGAAHYGRAVRDMVALAMAPAVRSRRAGGGSEPPLLSRICALIDADPAAPPGAEAMADLLGAAPSSVRQALADAGGAAALIARRRLLLAYRLLTDPAETASVSAIARRCGFDDMPRFSRAFRAVFDTSASDLRRRPDGRLPAWAGAYHVEQRYRALIVDGAARRSG